VEGRPETELLKEANARGAGSNVWEKHFEIPALKPLRVMMESVAATPRGVFVARSA